jgi:hypothetical protein
MYIHTHTHTHTHGTSDIPQVTANLGDVELQNVGHSEVCTSVKRDLMYRQKRPSIQAKETPRIQIRYGKR